MGAIMMPEDNNNPAGNQDMAGIHGKKSSPLGRAWRKLATCAGISAIFAVPVLGYLNKKHEGDMLTANSHLADIEEEICSIVDDSRDIERLGRAFPINPELAGGASRRDYEADIISIIPEMYPSMASFTLDGGGRCTGGQSEAVFSVIAQYVATRNGNHEIAATVWSEMRVGISCINGHVVGTAPRWGRVRTDIWRLSGSSGKKHSSEAGRKKSAVPKSHGKYNVNSGKRFHMPKNKGAPRQAPACMPKSRKLSRIRRTC
jgi:hypothetical protein